MHKSPAHTRGAIFRNEDGAFDLPSILVGVVVVGVLAAGVLASVFGIIPFAQDNGIKQDLSAIRTAQGVAMAKDGRYMTDDELVTAGYLTGQRASTAASAAPAQGALAIERVAAKTGGKKAAAGTSSDGSCFISVGQSASGSIFSLSSQDSTAKKLKPSSVPECLPADALRILLDAIGGFGPEYLPGAPAGVTGSATAPTTATFTWPAVEGASGYTVSYSINGGALQPLPAQTGTTATVEVPAGSTVAVEVEAVNLAGESAPTTGAVDLSAPSPTPAPSTTPTPTALAPGGTAFPLAGAGMGSWGYNPSGELGNGTTAVTALSATGVDIPGTVTQLSMGHSNHACAVSSGAAYCWGANGQGQLGDGTKTNASTPVRVGGILAGKTVTSVSAGSLHSCAIADGLAYCWGQVASGAVGTGATTGNQLTPAAVDTTGPLSGMTIKAISAGSSHSCAVTTTNKVACWGNAGAGRLGNAASTGTYYSPSTTGLLGVLDGKTVTAISAGQTHTCAVADGAAYCWGDHNHGRLGNPAATGAKYAPYPVDASGALNGKTVTSIAAGASGTCAIASGAAYCWGSNAYGQSGDGTTVNAISPVAVQGLTGTVTNISQGAYHSCAVAGGSAFCWGMGGGGRLGSGTTESSTTARLVPGLDRPVTMISAGSAATLAAF